MYNDYDFCRVCQKRVDKGVTIIQVTENQNENPPFSEGVYPTGKWAVVPPEQIEPHTGIVFVNEETWKSFGLPE